MGLIEKTILKHKDTFSQFLDIGISVNEITAKVNAYDWFDLQEAKNESDIKSVVNNIWSCFNFKIKKEHSEIINQAFYYKFLKSIIQIKEAIEYTNASYNIPNSSGGFENDIVNKYYYLNYWANKKNIPLNINEKDQPKRELFNLDTIILSILAEKLQSYNEYERNKPKTKG